MISTASSAATEGRTASRPVPTAVVVGQLVTEDGIVLLGIELDLGWPNEPVE